MKCRCDPPRESRDPRRAGECDRCGHHIDRTLGIDRVREHHYERAQVTEWAGAIPRDERFQTQFTDAAGVASRMPTSAREMNDLAWARALPGDVRTMGRSFGRERAEEIADCWNYTVWDLQALGLRNDPDAVRARELLVETSQKLVALWHVSQQVRTLLGR